MENIVFADGKCTIPGIVSLEAPLEAFGNVKLTNAFKELDNSKIRMVATAVGLTTREKNPAGEEVHVPDSEVFGMTMFTLQHAWFEAIPGGITKNAAKNYADRQEKYWAVLESIKAGIEGRHGRHACARTAPRKRTANRRAPNRCPRTS